MEERERKKASVSGRLPSMRPSMPVFFVCIFVGGCDIVFERRMDREDWGKVKK